MSRVRRFVRITVVALAVGAAALIGVSTSSPADPPAVATVTAFDTSWS